MVLDNYDTLTVSQLRDKLKLCKLSTCGTKAELLSRLRENDLDVGESASVASNTSTTSSVRAKAAARRAALQVEAAALAEQQQLEMQELILQQRKEELSLKTNLAKVRAEEEALDYYDQDPPISKLTSNGEPAAINLHITEETAAMENRKQSNATSDYRRLVDIINVPRVELSKFSGEPLQYWTFIRSFDNSVHHTSLDDGAKLTRLLYYCQGRASTVIAACAVMEPSAGYNKARELLHERFGDNHVILEAWLKKIHSYKASDLKLRTRLQDYADELRSCKESLSSMGYKQEINNQQTLVKIIEKLPMYLRSRWLKEVHTIKSYRQRLPNIDDLVNFIVNSAVEANDPVYGNLCDTSPTEERSKKLYKHTNFNVSISKPKSSQLGEYKNSIFDNNSTLKFDNNSNSTFGNNFNSKFRNYSNSKFGKSNHGNYNYNFGKNCILCGNSFHSLFGCDKFKSKNVTERLKIVRDSNLCYNCLSPGHRASTCSLNRVCSVNNCGKKHTKFIHVDPTEYPLNREDISAFGTNNGEVKRETATTIAATGMCGKLANKNSCEVALPILPVKVKASDGVTVIETLALLDTGSTNSFCTKDLLFELGISVEGLSKYDMLVATLGGHSKEEVAVVNLQVAELNSSKYFEINSVYSKSKLNVNPPPDIPYLEHLNGKGIYPRFKSHSVNLLIGQDLSFLLMPLEILKGNIDEPYATRTELGWALNGPLGMKRNNRKLPVSAHYSSMDMKLEQQVEQFWKMDASELLFQDDKGMSINDKRALNVWNNSVQLKDGHYELAIPFKDTPVSLPDNKFMAEHRLNQLKRKLKSDDNYLKNYKVGMADLLQKGYAEMVPDEELGRSDGAVWYIPHHPVKHLRKPKKFRIVFDCAAKYKNVSLNDKVFQGPDLTNQLIGVLMRFRIKPVALMADIESMFHQVQVRKQDQDVLRFMWWPDANLTQEPKIYRMKVHLFGGTWSPSCCNFALRRTAIDHENEYNVDVINSVLNNFYVDDLLKSVDNDNVGVSMVKEIASLLKQGGFRLTKWISNSSHVMLSIPESERATGNNFEFNDEALPMERALGVSWNVHEDCFCYQVVLQDKPLTRRGILSMVSSVYDPCGFVSPFILTAKRLIQDLSIQNLGWDEQLPASELNRWLEWKRDLPTIESFQMKRCIQPNGFGKITEYEIHNFADASEYAYGVTSYVKLINANGDVYCVLLLAKSRLAPVRRITIPRLELAAAALAVKLNAKLHHELDFPISRTVFWTDSMIVLQYIRNDCQRFHTYVANRVSLIRNGSTPDQWKYVESLRNPADDASRGLSAHNLVTNLRWINGPLFLYENEEMWPEEPVHNLFQNEVDPEIKKPNVMSALVMEETSLQRMVQHYSNWIKLKRSVAWLIMFCKKDVYKNMLMTRMEQAEKAIIQDVQFKEFEKEVSELKKLGHVSKSSRLVNLDPFIDDDGLLRVGGRISRAALEFSLKHPIILPKKGNVTEMIIRHYHELSGHAGRNQVLSSVRNKFWIIHGNAAVRQILYKCIHCRRYNWKSTDQKMSDLPVDRITPDAPFTQVGVDYFGPFYIKYNRKQVKRYGVIFTCLTSRAVHLEAAASLDTDSFLNALQRFISRRGPIKILRSDNGTNFIGAEKELRQSVQSLNCERLENKLMNQGIKWIFNPPKASHHGGVWERMIRSVRQILAGLMKEHGGKIDEEGFQTLLCEVEGILNSRPITTITDDPQDLQPLTPSMLLTMKSQSNTLYHGQPVGIYSRSRWRRVQYVAQIFWSRWRKEFLTMLQKRQKWTSPRRNFKSGDIVLLKEETERSFWPLGIVTETKEDEKGFIRVVSVRTASGRQYVRSINHVVLLIEV